MGGYYSLEKNLHHSMTSSYYIRHKKFLSRANSKVQGRNQFTKSFSLLTLSGAAINRLVFESVVNLIKHFTIVIYDSRFILTRKLPTLKL